MVHPTPNRLIGHGHSAFRQQIFDVAQAEGEPEVEPYRLVNDLRRETISVVADFLHPLGYSATGQTASPTPRDNAQPRRQPSSTQALMVKKGSPEALAFSGVRNCGLKGDLHDGARHCRDIDARG